MHPMKESGHTMKSIDRKSSLRKEDLFKKSKQYMGRPDQIDKLSGVYSFNK